ncbi:MAG: 2-phospho-L-lactate guanylyltransferase [Halobacteria archaeon]
MRAIIPFKKQNAKSRLAPFFNQEEREKFAIAMLKDVIKALKKSKVSEVKVLAMSREGLGDIEVEIEVSDKGLNEAINEQFAKAKEAVLIVMADLPLIQAEHIDEIIACKEDVVIAFGKGGGTNVMLVRQPSKFRADYYEISYLKHKKIAMEAGLSFKAYDSFFTACDIDEVWDIAELLIHGRGEAAEYLRELGLKLVESKGRVSVRR